MSDMLSNRVVLITGAAGALGSAVTRAFAASGARLALAGTSLAELEALIESVDLPVARAFPMAADLTREDDVAALVEAVAGRFGPVDVLANVVGGWSGGVPLHEMAVSAWDHALDLNLRTAFLISRAVLPGMLAAGWGRIIHTSSKAAVAPRAKQAGYAVAKMGVIALTEAIAEEVKGTGVTANVVLPSIIDTPANRRAMPKADPGKWVPAEHIAAVMTFLCSDAAASINGTRVPVYGAV
ncbi:MAG: SDR family oxidoreductase [Anaerolineae bacterium]|nr:SDR family oxidoreductase [Anaerolineae bacterium]